MRRTDYVAVTLDVPQRPVGFGVPRLAEWRFPHITEVDVDRTRVDVTVGVDAGGLPRIEALLDKGVIRILEAPPNLFLRLEGRSERH